MPTPPTTTTTPSNTNPRTNHPQKPHQPPTSIDDLSFPRSLTIRLAKSVLPAHTSLQKQAVAALSHGTTVFVNFLGGCATEIARAEGRKGVNAQDVLKALRVLEFGDFVPRLERELEVFTEIEVGKKVGKGKGREAVGSVEKEVDAPSSKRVRVEGGEGAEPDTREKEEVSEFEDEEVEEGSHSEDEAVVSDEEGEDAAAGATSDAELDRVSEPGTEAEDDDDALDDGDNSD